MSEDTEQRDVRSIKQRDVRSIQKKYDDAHAKVLKRKQKLLDAQKEEKLLKKQLLKKERDRKQEKLFHRAIWSSQKIIAVYGMWKKVEEKGYPVNCSGDDCWYGGNMDRVGEHKTTYYCRFDKDISFCDMCHGNNWSYEYARIIDNSEKMCEENYFLSLNDIPKNGVFKFMRSDIREGLELKCSIKAKKHSEEHIFIRGIVFCMTHYKKKNVIASIE